MKKFLHILALSLLFSMMAVGSVRADVIVNVDGIHYEVHLYRCSVLGCDAGITELIIPDSIVVRGEAKPVYRIVSGAFEGNTELRKVKIVKAPATPGGGNFLILDDAFKACTSLNELELDFTGKIEPWAFSGCTSLQTLTIDSNINIGDHAFENCTGLTSIDLSLGKYYEFLREDYWLVSGQASACAFKDCTSLKEAHMHSGYDSFAFVGCTALEVITGDGDCYTADSGAYQDGLPNLKRVEFKDVMNISRFNNCTSLTSAHIKFKEGKTGYTSGVFSGCTSLSDLQIDGGYQEMLKDAFKDCVQLTEFTIPSTLTSISPAFSGCTSLKRLVFADYIPPTADLPQQVDYDDMTLVFKSGPGVLDAVQQKMTIEVKAGDVLSYKGWVGKSGQLDVDVTCGSFKHRRTFSGNQKAEVVMTITESGEAEIYALFHQTSHDYAYGEVAGLTNITLNAPEHVKKPEAELKIASSCCDEYLFPGNHFESVYIGKQIVKTAFQAYGTFAGSSKLRDVEFFDFVEYININDFKDCTALRRVVLGTEMARIADAAFAGCVAMDELICRAEEPPVCGQDVFAGVDKKNCRLSVPEASVEKYRNAPQWKDFFKIEPMAGIDEIEVDHEWADAPVVVYNLNGLKVADSTEGLPAGLYIVRQGGKVEKVAVP
ncbi:MAG: leucine-rich repeat domain-containing protein [Muribaculaceae bacterium]|nr:leucine-rich repeat domain-containing protein [Muribaculaceae bacterium]